MMHGKENYGFYNSVLNGNVIGFGIPEKLQKKGGTRK